MPYVVTSANGVVLEKPRVPTSVPTSSTVEQAERYAQFTVAGFAYPRRDLSGNARFVGPVARVARTEVLPEWWGDMDGGRPIVHVSQGTIANEDSVSLSSARSGRSRDVTCSSRRVPTPLTPAQRGRRSIPSRASTSPSAMRESIARSRWRGSGHSGATAS